MVRVPNFNRFVIKKTHEPDASDTPDRLFTGHGLQLQIFRCGGVKRNSAAPGVKNKIHCIGKISKLPLQQNDATC